MNMKKVLITMTMLLTLIAGMQAAGQKHRHTPQQVTQQELVDSTSKDAIEVFSDTTSADTSSAHGTYTVTTHTPWSTTTRSYDVYGDDFEMSILRDVFSHVRWNGVFAVLGILGTVFFIFVVLPILLLILLFVFLNRRKKTRIKSAYSSAPHEQPRLETVDAAQEMTNEYQKGLRQCFVGVGLMIFLAFAAGTVGFGVGALVFCIGLGKVVASKTVRKDNRDELNIDNNIK